jgi:nicotinamide-nucleotide amidase
MSVEDSAAPPNETAAEVGGVLDDRGSTVAVAESLTGGLLVQALARIGGSGDWLLGGVVAYRRSVKHDVLGVTATKVVSADAAAQMATGVRRLLGGDVAVAVTGVAGPDPQDGEPPGTVWLAVDLGAGPATELLSATGTPAEICAQAVEAALRLLVTALQRAGTGTRPKSTH